MEALPVNNLPVSSILSTLGIASKKAKDIFYNSNGTLKSELELGNMVSGTLNTSYCPDLATLRTRRNLVSFKGYSPTSLSLSALSITKRSNSLSGTTVNVSGVVTYTLSYNTSLLNILKHSDYFVVNWKAVNTSTLSQKQTTITVTGGGESEVVTIKQLVKPYISNLPSNPHISNSIGNDSPPWENFLVVSNYGREWDVSSSNRDFFGSIDDEGMLRISYVPELSIGYNDRTGTATMTISLDGVSYSLSVSGTYRSGGSEGPGEL